MISVTLRFFAAAKASAGRAEAVLSAPGAMTIADVLHLARSASADYDAVMSRCSFLVNSVATTDRGQTLADGDILDVMPPFAGG